MVYSVMSARKVMNLSERAGEHDGVLFNQNERERERESPYGKGKRK